jgi:hypothetical protein
MSTSARSAEGGPVFPARHQSTTGITLIEIVRYHAWQIDSYGTVIGEMAVSSFYRPTAGMVLLGGVRVRVEATRQPYHGVGELDGLVTRAGRVLLVVGVVVGDDANKTHGLRR